MYKVENKYRIADMLNEVVQDYGKEQTLLALYEIACSRQPLNTIGPSYATLTRWFNKDNVFHDRVMFGAEIDVVRELEVEPPPAKRSTAKERRTEDDQEDFLARITETLAVTPRLSSVRPTAVITNKVEEACLILSDLHPGRKTATFNSNVYLARVAKIRDKVIALSDHYRRTGTSMNKLHIFDLGDNVHGENVGRQGRMQDFEFGIPEQLTLAVQTHVDLYTSLLEHFTDIVVYDSPGNHGDLDKKYSTGSNWDWVRANMIELAFGSESRISFVRPANPHNTAVQYADVGPWRFAYMHGDAVSSTGGSPYGSIVRKFGQYQGIEAGKGEPFHLGMMGHFHHPFYVVQNHMPIFMNGTAVSDDEYALSLGYDSVPSQWFFGFNESRPVTFQFNLFLEEVNGSVRKGQRRWDGCGHDEERHGERLPTYTPGFVHGGRFA